MGPGGGGSNESAYAPTYYPGSTNRRAQRLTIASGGP